MKPVRQPWSALAEGDSAERRAGALLRHARVPAPMSDTQLAAVRARLRRDRAPVPRWTRTWQVAVALAVMLMAGVLFAAARRFWPRPAPVIAPRVVSAAAAQPVKRRRAPPREQQVIVAPAAEPPVPAMADATPLVPRAPVTRPSVPASTATVRVPERSAASAFPASLDPSPDMHAVPAPTAAPPVVGAPPPPSRLAEESRLLALALRELRQENDPAAALARLDQHAARFGVGGALVAEADTARVEALLRLGRHAEALVRLDGMTLSGSGRTRALLAARAELRAEQGRCSAASLDFDRLLAGAGEHDAIAERALHGRAACRAQAGDVAGAREDLETYLVQFPDGRFAGDARATLGR